MSFWQHFKNKTLRQIDSSNSRDILIIIKSDVCFKKTKNTIFNGEFFLTGLIWGSTVFCINIWNITLIHMVKLHLPHMYMFLLIISKEKIISMYSTIPPNLSILLGAYATFSNPSLRILWVRSNFFKDPFFFFCGFDRGTSRVFRSLSPILQATSSSFSLHGLNYSSTNGRLIKPPGK